MKKLLKYLRLFLILFAMGILFYQNPVYAMDFNSIEITVDKDQIQSNIPEIKLDKNLNLEENEIEISTIEYRQTLDQNIPPVAGLRYLVLNEDSLINGNMTTNTQIAWLWSYGGQDFTYDPDGDSITQVYISGIPSDSIIGTINGGIGFATQFSVPGQYEMLYQVEDARGAKSNIVKIVLDIEPADGNHRPEISFSYSPQEAAIGQEIKFSWAGSADPDPGDTIADIKGLVIKDGIYENISAYIKKLGQTSLTIAFDQPGEYEIRISVSDNHGAWSDWGVCNINVTPPDQFVDVKIRYMSLDNFYPEITTGQSVWLDLSSEILTPFLKWPSDLSNKVIDGNTWVSGYLYDSNGNPKPNTTVTLEVPVTTSKYIRTVKTDDNGYFYINEYYSKGFYESMGFHSSYPNFGDCSGRYTKYALRVFLDEGCHSFFCNTKLYLMGGNAVFTEDCSVEAGILYSEYNIPMLSGL